MSRRWDPDRIVDDYLLRDEVVKLDVTRSFKSWVIEQALWIGLALVAFVVLATIGSDATLAIGLALLVGLGGYLVLDWQRKRFTRYVVTDLRVLRITGVLHRRMEFIPWGKVTDVSRTESLIQWLAGTVTIRIESANERSAFREMTDVSDPERFYNVIVRMVDLKQGRVDNHEHVR